MEHDNLSNSLGLRARRHGFRMAITAAGAFMTLAAATAFAQPTIYHVLTRDQLAYANLSMNSADGCQSSALEVFASRSMTRYVSDFSFYMPLVRAQFTSYNYCTGVLSFRSGADEAPVIDIKPDLTRANVKAIVVMDDGLGTQQTAQVNLLWSGGELTTDKSKTVYTSPYSRTMIRSAASIRRSNSVTGSLMLDGVDLLAVPGSGASGFVTSSKGASIDVIRSPRP